MYGSAEGRKAHEEECATPEGLQMLFSEQMEALHTLSFLLTADEIKAEKCFVAGLEDSLEGNLIFRQWARSWARRAIIRNAIRLMAPAPCPEGDGNETAVSNQADFQPCTEQEAIINAVIKLPAFERFVFVLSVLEGHSLSDTASLLGCTNSQLAQARSRALAHVAGYLAQNLESSSGDPHPHWYARLETA